MVRVLAPIGDILQELQAIDSSLPVSEFMVFFAIIGGVATAIFDFPGFIESAPALEAATNGLVESTTDAISLLSDITNPIRQSHDLLVVTPHMYDVITNIQNANDILENNLQAYEVYLQVPDNISTAGAPDSINNQISTLIEFRGNLETMLRIPRVLEQVHQNFTSSFADENIVDFLAETRGLLAEFNRYSNIIDRLIELRNNAVRSI